MSLRTNNSLEVKLSRKIRFFIFLFEAVADILWTLSRLIHHYSLSC